jgi:hypothetical protein
MNTDRLILSQPVRLRYPRKLRSSFSSSLPCRPRSLGAADERARSEVLFGSRRPAPWRSVVTTQFYVKLAAAISWDRGIWRGCSSAGAARAERGWEARHSTPAVQLAVALSDRACATTSGGSFASHRWRSTGRATEPRMCCSASPPAGRTNTWPAAGRAIGRAGIPARSRVSQQARSRRVARRMPDLGAAIILIRMVTTSGQR